MKIKQLNHMWNGQDSKNSSQSFPRPPRITGQKMCQSNGHTIPPPPIQNSKLVTQSQYVQVAPV